MTSTYCTRQERTSQGQWTGSRSGTCFTRYIIQAITEKKSIYILLHYLQSRGTVGKLLSPLITKWIIPTRASPPLPDKKKKPSQEITKDAVLLSPSAFHAMQWTKTFCLRTLAPQVPSTPCGSNSNMHLGGSVRQQRSLYCSYGNKTRDQLRYSSARQCYVLFYVWTPRKLGRYEREIIAIPSPTNTIWRPRRWGGR